MEMWLKRLTLVLLTAALVTSDQDLVILDEKQNKVEVLVGSSVTFDCRIMPATPDRHRVVWRFSASGSSVNDSYKINNSSGELNNTKYILLNATDKNSGWYFCQIIVEIPLLNITNSSGTQVVVTKSKEHTTYPPLPIVTGKQATASPTDNFPVIAGWIWIVLGVSAFILIVLLVTCVLLRRRCRRSRGEEPIYVNSRHVASKQSSPRPGLPGDNLKMVSSSQNLHNPSPGQGYHKDKRRFKQ
ncbi:uncharacterized protein LOC115007273 isoform X2 [Cottoperca gobio]|uniref:Uncharacterized protein LOC115007273 isoform X2 n=1 Tax=Cottoperca gobio TaxID=56716 RepID=A0A6J2PKN0_COTGO|nr:uncharacterized protein LOC115007273 isoform X2 [Cottoperca gobio]